MPRNEIAQKISCRGFHQRLQRKHRVLYKELFGDVYWCHKTRSKAVSRGEDLPQLPPLRSNSISEDNQDRNLRQGLEVRN